MKNNFIITTTNNVEGCPIRTYIDSICANIVIGTNIFSDFAASFTDFFGGRSGSYKNKLDIIYNEAIKELKDKAKRMGANAIIGLNVDFGEISGKDKSMFMVSVTGTACIIEQTKPVAIEHMENIQILQTEIDKEVTRRSIVSQVNSGKAVSANWMDFLLENPQVEIAEALIKRYINEEGYEDEMNFIIKHLKLIKKECLVDFAYSSYSQNPKNAKKLIHECRLFDANKILALVETDFHIAIDLLLTDADFYTKEDLEVMKMIVAQIDALPNTGRIEMVKGGLLSKDQEKFICERGHKNNPNNEFCDTCGLNIKGLHYTETEVVSKFKEQIQALSDLLLAKRDFS